MRAPDVTTVGGRIHAARLALGASQEEIALRLPKHERQGKDEHRSRNYIGDFERGARSPTVEELEDLGPALKQTPLWLAYGDTSGDSELVAAIRALEAQMDVRARLTVLQAARLQAELSSPIQVDAAGSQLSREIARMEARTPTPEASPVLREAAQELGAPSLAAPEQVKPKPPARARRAAAARRAPTEQ